jgi:hypothetical protein
MNSPLKLSALESLGVLRARGPDVVSFLQGQLSNDLAQLSATRALLAGYHNPQGRTIALLRLIENAPGDVLAILPRELTTAVAARLTKFILRSKVKLADESAAWSLHGLTGADSTPVALPAQVNEVARSGAALLVCTGTAPARTLIVQPRESAAVLGGVQAAPESVWHAATIAAAEPQVYAATSEEFVAQMLNLDALGAIAFEKGCYTGQEVIARAHYRGRVKRRLQRFLSGSAAQLAPGELCELPDGRSVKVVDAIQHGDGRCEFLGVTTVASASQEAATPGARRLDAAALPMPYPLPS